MSAMRLSATPSAMPTTTDVMVRRRDWPENVGCGARPMASAVKSGVCHRGLLRQLGEVFGAGARHRPHPVRAAARAGRAGRRFAKGLHRLEAVVRLARHALEQRVVERL